MIRRVRHALERRRLAPAQLEALRGRPPGRRVMVFLIPGKDEVNGGVLSISSLAEESQALSSLHGAEVYLCPLPNGPPLARFTRFDNPHTLVDFRLLLRQLAPGTELFLHLPEIWVRGAVRALRGTGACRFPLRFNILLQNIDLAPRPDDVVLLRRLGPVTITTAHKAYSSPETSRRYGCPVHHLSVWVCPERFLRRPEAAKEDLFLVSPDPHPRRDEVLAELARRLPEYRQQVVRDLAYQDYRDLAGRARYSLTFGEGLDGYFIEPVFSGGIGCAVYNDRFFTPRYRELPCVYPGWDELVRRLPEDVRRLRDPGAYATAQARQFDTLAADYRRSEYLENLRRFYLAAWPS